MPDRIVRGPAQRFTLLWQPEVQPRPVTDRLRPAISAVYRRPWPEIAGRGRTRPVAEARALAAWMLRRSTGLSLSAIGQRIGGRDHSTVLDAIRGVDALLADPGERGAELRRRAAQVAALARIDVAIPGGADA